VGNKINPFLHHTNEKQKRTK